MSFLMASMSLACSVLSWLILVRIFWIASEFSLTVEIALTRCSKGDDKSSVVLAVVGRGTVDVVSDVFTVLVELSVLDVVELSVLLVLSVVPLVVVVVVVVVTSSNELSFALSFVTKASRTVVLA